MKVAFLCPTSVNVFYKNVILNVLKSKNHEFICAFIDCRPNMPPLQKLKLHIRKKRFGYIFILIIKKITRRKSVTYNTEIIFSKNNVDVEKTTNPYSDEYISLIIKREADILVYIGGFGKILKKKLLHCTKMGVLSYHHGDLRKYRGQPAAFWELLYGETEMKATIQLLNEELDKGEPIIEKDIEILKCDNLKKLTERLYANTDLMMIEALDIMDNTLYQKKKIDYALNINTLPSLKYWILLQFKIIGRIIFMHLKLL